ncbi:MAG: lytic transglycosylase domain-containing protein [Desulfobaccales bacterium]
MAANIGPIRGKNKWIFKITILLFIVSGLGNISLAQAQSFQRVYKNGVIYYYFSTRGEGGYFKSNQNTISSPMGRKVSPLELDPVVQEASRHYNLPPGLIKALIRVESNFVTTAKSPKGAQGLMQLMPGTAEELQVRNPYDIRENIWAGTRYLGMLLQRFNNHLPSALAAYNAGPHRVEKYQGIPPIEETKNFVQNVCANFLKYSGKPLPSP